MAYTAWLMFKADQGHEEQLLRSCEEQYSADPVDGFRQVNLGTAYLWLRRYERAAEHYEAILKVAPAAGDDIFGMAGVAKWCLGEKKEAVALWNRGRRAKYSRGGLTVAMPLLMLFASILDPESYDKAAAENLLREVVKNPLIRYWPGPIARMIVGEISETELSKELRGYNEADSRGREWDLKFYRSLLDIGESRSLRFKHAMREPTDLQRPEWQDERYFSKRVRHEELFLARHEVETGQRGR